MLTCSQRQCEQTDLCRYIAQHYCCVFVACMQVLLRAVADVTVKDFVGIWDAVMDGVAQTNSKQLDISSATCF